VKQVYINEDLSPEAAKLAYEAIYSDADDSNNSKELKHLKTRYQPSCTLCCLVYLQTGGAAAKASSGA